MLARPILADVTAAAGTADPVNDTFRTYWVYGKGRAKWTTWTQLYRHLKKHVSAERAKRIAASWFHLRYGYWPGDHRNEDAEEAHMTAPSGDTTPRVAVREATGFGSTSTGSGRLLCHLIRAGWSLNGNHYGAEVLRQAAEARAFPRGTQAFIDHATDAEEEARPAGSVRNLAAVLAEDARWDEAEQALVAEVRLFAPWRETITDMAEAIGLSIRAWVHGDQGEVAGRRGFVVSQIAEGRSVDFVTVPAAGGRIVSVLESVGHHVPTAEARNIGAWLESRLHLALTTYADDMYGDGRLTRQERIVLSGAVGDGLTAWSARVEADAPQLFERDLWDYPEPAATPAEETARAQRRTAEATAEELRAALGHAISAAHGGDQSYCWVRDFDPGAGAVWFDVNTTDGVAGTWQQAYTADDTGTVTLTGDRTEVTARTVYTPVADTTESAPPTTVTTATAVAEDVTDGTPPTGPNPPIEEEPAMSGTQAGAPPVQAGTPPVPGDGQPPTPTTPLAVPQPTPAEPAQESATVAALRTVTEQLAAMGRQLAEVTARADQRDADNRRLRNETTAREAVTAAVNAPTVPARWRTQIAPRVTAAVLAAVPTGADGNVDTTALGEAVTAAIQAEVTHAQTIEAQALDAAGIGTPTGLGSVQEAAVDDGLDAELTALFTGSLGLSDKAATVAVKGRG